MNKGTKVTPIARNSSDPGQGLFRSKSWRDANRISQPFLYVQKVDGELTMLGTEKDGESGEWFEAWEFKPYECGKEVLL